jgi:hypothetical protein
LALHAVGFGVSIWSPSVHPLLKTDAVDQHYPYGAVGQDSLETAILAANPDLIVPCDDPATSRLQRLAGRALIDSRLHRVLSVIERSLGPAADLNKVTERAYVLEVAAEGGVAVPANARLTSSADLRAWFHEYGFPAYIKADGTFGGTGVRPVHTYQQAESSAARLVRAARYPGRVQAAGHLPRSYLDGPLGTQRAASNQRAALCLRCRRQ